MKRSILTAMTLAALVSYTSALAEDTYPDSPTTDSSDEAKSSQTYIRRTRARRTISVSYGNGVLSITPYNTYNEISILVTNTETSEEYEYCSNLSDRGTCKCGYKS